jgi:hypothetical protein
VPVEKPYTVVEAFAEVRRDEEFPAKYVVSRYLGTDAPPIPEHLGRKPVAPAPPRADPPQQLRLFAEPGKRGGIIPAGPVEGETFETIAVGFRPAEGDPDAAEVTFMAADPGSDREVRLRVRAADVPEGLAIGDMCTLAWRGGGWRLSSVDWGAD